MAKKYLKAPSKRGIKIVLRLAVLGLALGVATLTLTQAVFRGFEQVFRQSILGFNAHLVVLKEGEMTDLEAEFSKIRRSLGDEYQDGTPFLYRETLLVAHGKVKGAVFKGIDPLTFARVYAVKVRPWTGTQVPAKIEDLLHAPVQFPAVILGKDLAEELEIRGPDETIKVFLPTQASKNKGGQEFQSFQVVGTFTTGLYEFDHGFAFADLSRMQQLVKAPGAATGIEMLLRHPLNADEIAGRLQGDLGLGYQAISWQKLNGQLFSALKKERWMFLVIMAMVVAVAAFNIIGVLSLILFDKSREVSLLRALGASRAALKRLFALQGLTIGAVGCFAGLLLGVGVAWLVKATGLLKLEKEVYLVERLPVEWSPALVMTVVAVSLGITLLVSWVAVTRLNKMPLDL